MGQETLLHRLDDFAGRAKEMMRERDEATARTASLEREVSELRNLISLAESKVEEMLKDGPTSDASRRMEELRRRFPLLFTLD